MHTVLVLGGYGNVGANISRALARDPGIRLLIAGRNLEKAQQFAASLGLPARRGQYLLAEVTTLASELRGLGVQTLIHAAGPFRGQDYRVARACIDAGCNYIDLADDRDFVCGITQLDAAAKSANVLVTSGAGIFPALSATVVGHFLPQFSKLQEVRIGFTSDSTTLGPASLHSLLETCGKPFKRTENGLPLTVHGGQDIQRHRYAQPVGVRWLGSLDTADYTLLPQRHADLKSLAIHVGQGVPGMQLIAWLLSWISRWDVMRQLSSWAVPLRWLSMALERLGSPNAAMHVELSGLDHQKMPLTRTWQLLALSHHGQYIPAGTAIALARKLTQNSMPAGATPCIGLLTLDEHLAAFNGLEIRQILS